MNKNINHPPDYSSAPQDNLILEHYGINELNFESIKNYRYKFSAIKPNHPWNGLETKEFLYKIGAWGKVRNTSKEGLTIAGLLMFSEERIITEVLPQYFLEYRESLEETEKGNWSKRFTSQDGTWSGNVFDFYFKASAELDADYTILDENNCFDQSDLSCLHEALINALVHSDYDGSGGIVIEKEKDLFRFSNPGLFRISVEQALQGNISNLRNPNLFKIFILIGLCKRTGSGLKNIKTTWEKNREGGLDIAQAADSKRTILTLHLKLNLLEEEEQLEEIDENDLFIFHEDEEPLTKNADDRMDSINKNGISVNKEENSNNIERNSSIITGNSINSNSYSVNKEENSIIIGINSNNKEGNSVNKEEHPFVRTFSSDNSEVHVTNHEHTYITASDSAHEQKEKAANSSSSKGVEEELWKISELARKKRRLQPSTMEEMIVTLCTQKPLMLKELAYLLERTPDGLRNNYLAKLLTKGKVRLKYPDQLNHPKQAYMVVEKKGQ